MSDDEADRDEAAKAIADAEGATDADTYKMDAAWAMDALRHCGWLSAAEVKSNQQARTDMIDDLAGKLCRAYAEMDTWRKRAEEAEAKFEKQREVSIDLAGDMCAARLDAEAKGRAIGACTDTIQDLKQDRDRLSRELDDARKDARCAREEFDNLKRCADRYYDKLAIAVKALENICEVFPISFEADVARRAIEALQTKETA